MTLPPFSAFCAALALLPVAPAAAQSVLCPAVTRAGISDLGFSSYRNGETYRGASVDVVNELGRRTGCTLRLGWYPRGRMFAELDKGHLDMVLGAAKTAARDRNSLFIPYSYTQFELLLTKKSAGNFSSLKDFVDHSEARLNLPRGMSHPVQVQVQLDRLEKAGRLEWVNDFDIVFKKIAAGRAEGTLAPPVIYSWYLHRLGKGDDMVMLQFPESPRQLIGLYVSTINMPPATQQLYAAAVHELVSDGSIVKIYGRYIDAAMLNRVYKGGLRDILDYKPN